MANCFQSLSNLFVLAYSCPLTFIVCSYLASLFTDFSFNFCTLQKWNYLSYLKYIFGLYIVIMLTFSFKNLKCFLDKLRWFSFCGFHCWGICFCLQNVLLRCSLRSLCVMWHVTWQRFLYAYNFSTDVTEWQLKECSLDLAVFAVWLTLNRFPHHTVLHKNFAFGALENCRNISIII